MRLNQQLLVFLPLQLVQQVTKNLECVLVLLLFEQKVSKVGLDAHSQERTLFLLAPLDDVSAKVDHFAEVVLRALVLVGDREIEQSSGDFGGLRLWEIDEQRQNLLLKLQKFVEKALVTVDVRKEVRGLLLLSDYFF